jgi:uncharacterized membrane protein YbhN (UPF0104 family)
MERSAYQDPDEQGSRDEPVRPRRWRAIRLVAAMLILLLAVLFLKRLLEEIGPSRVLQALLDADPLLLLLTFTAIAARYWLWAGKWRAIARREHLPVHNRAFFPSLLCGSFTDLVAPTAKTAGGFLRTYLVATRSRMPAFKIYGTTLQDQVTNMLGVFLVSFIAMAAIPFWQQPEHRAASSVTAANRLVISGLGFAGILGLVALLVFRRQLGHFLSTRNYRGLLTALYRPLKLLPPVRARYASAEEFADSILDRSMDIFGPLRRLLESKRGTFKDVSKGAFLWLCYCAGNYFAFQACGAGEGETPLLMVAAILSLGNLLGIISTVPGGIGVTEASLIGLHIFFGVRPELAAAASLLFRLAYYLFILISGAISFAWASRIRKRMARKEADLEAALEAVRKMDREN